jgi:hypothetical protein
VEHNHDANKPGRGQLLLQACSEFPSLNTLRLDYRAATPPGTILHEVIEKKLGVAVTEAPEETKNVAMPNLTKSLYSMAL